MHNHRISVVIPAHNAAAYLSESLDSVLAQTLPAAEILVVDDGSTDGTADVASRFGRAVRVVRQPQSGVSVARNIGLDRAAGDLIAFLDADDRWEPGKLATQVAAIDEQPAALWTFCWYYEFGSTVVRAEVPAALINGTFDAELLVPDVTVLPSTAMVRASATVRFPEWAPSNANEDSVYFNDLLQQGRFVFTPEPLVGYRRHPHSAQKRPGHVERACGTLMKWVDLQPAERQPRLRRKVLHALARQAATSKWSRDWERHASIRDFCLRHWPPDEPKPRVLMETVWPPLAYRAKDCFDRLTGASSRT